MPRGRKKAVSEETVQANVSEVKQETERSNSNSRKPYPTHDERIAMADVQIAHWEALNAKRRVLVASTEKTLNDRKDALIKGEAELQRQIEWKQRLIEIKDGVAPAARSQSRRKYNELMSALKASGKSMDELLSELIPGKAQEA